MNNPKLELLLLRLRNLQSEIDGINQCAQRDNQFRDFWQCDWDGARRDVQRDFNNLVEEIKANL